MVARPEKLLGFLVYFNQNHVLTLRNTTLTTNAKGSSRLSYSGRTNNAAKILSAVLKDYTN